MMENISSAWAASDWQSGRHAPPGDRPRVGAVSSGRTSPRRPLLPEESLSAPLLRCGTLVLTGFPTSTSKSPLKPTFVPAPPGA